MHPPSRQFPLHLHRRVSLKLTFDFAADSALAFDELQCHLEVDGQVQAPYGSGVYLLRQLWSPARQQAQGPTREARLVNGYLSEIRADHWAILLELKRAGLEPTAAAIQQQWQSGRALSAQLMPLYEEHLTRLHQRSGPDRLSQHSLYRWNRGYHQLKDYLAQQQLTELAITGVSIGLAKTYYYWLRARPLSIDSAARYVGHLKEVLQFAVEEDLLANNKLTAWHIKAQPPKTVYCLSPAQLQQLQAMALPQPLDVIRRWALLSCYTGLDFKDAVRLARHPSAYLVHSAHGAKIVIQRLKLKALPRAQPEWGVCHIPLLAEAKVLLEQAPDWPPVTIQRVNRNLGEIEKRLGLPFRLSTKICRKTAGALFLLRGYRTEAVQKILGLRHLRTLERHYLHLYSELVDDTMRQQAHPKA
ncbi:tyrosine-type recombinase/integrase [Larkinella insperata]|uniref:Tyrosine-type recombinase/integrase n=1 Tax=Larkinella insperata TaxID=332158 RepID=A0ABW3QGV7_9BACT